MIKIPIFNNPGMFALIDKEDYGKVKDYKWSVHKSGYVTRSKRRKEPNCKNLTIHRVIMDCPDDMVVDHINFNKLDNRKSNLRIVTREENSAHQPPYDTWKNIRSGTYTVQATVVYRYYVEVEANSGREAVDKVTYGFENNLDEFKDVFVADANSLNRTKFIVLNRPERGSDDGET